MHGDARRRKRSFPIPLRHSGYPGWPWTDLAANPKASLTAIFINKHGIVPFCSSVNVSDAKNVLERLEMFCKGLNVSRLPDGSTGTENDRERPPSLMGGTDEERPLARDLGGFVQG